MVFLSSSLLATVLLALDVAAPSEPVTFISEPAALAAIEASGGGLAERLTGARSANNEALARTVAFGSVASVVEADLAEVRRADAKAGVGMKFAHRLFDARWLRAPSARFQLIGVVNRVDRRAFHPGTCGEVRFLYRLAYEKKTPKGVVASRLPMTVNLVFWQQPPPDAGDCGAVARRWLAPAGASGERLARWALDGAGPLRLASLSRARLKSLEINLQSERWPSAVRPDLGGHAGYLLRVFHPVAGAERLEAAPLENVPDVARLRQDAGLRAELGAWLKDARNAPAIDDGIAAIPEKFLARRAVSVAPRGLARLANRPFEQLFPGDELGALRTRRLDGMSCMGCHQSRSIAGFHFIGVEPSPTKDVDAVAVAMSPHLHDEVGRRAHYLLSLAAGPNTSKPDERRPLPERGAHAGDYGSHCGLTAAFAAWTCNPGLRCVAVDEPDVGVCLAAASEVGDPCEPGRLSPNADPHRDRVTLTGLRACAGEQVCEATSVGFPGGMCTAACGEGGPSATCGSIALLTPFNNCLARGEPFESCVRANVRPAALRACDFTHPCRDDYVCARAGQDHGTCIPPYFLFQMRVDGHPAPD